MIRVAAARAFATAFWILTAFYALLSAIPFASKHFLEPQLVPALVRFARWHAPISFVVLAATLALLAPWLRARNRGVLFLAGVWAASVVLEASTRGLTGLQPSWTAVVVAAAALIPPVWLARLDLRGARAAAAPVDATVVADFAACMIAGLVVALAHLATSIGTAGAPIFDVLGRTIRLHLLVFSAVFAALSVIRGLARTTLRPLLVERWLTRATLTLVFATFIDRIVLTPLSFTGPRATVMSAALGAALAMLIGPRGTSSPDGIASALSGLIPAWAARSPRLAAAWVALAMVALTAAERAIARSDWNFATGKVLAFASWLIVLTAALRVLPARRWTLFGHPSLAAAPFVLCVVVLGVDQVVARVPEASSNAGSDVSTRLIADALAPEAVADRSLYEYLQRNTNIPRSVAIQPVDVEFARLAGPSAWRPHIFVFIVDSLRRDYVSPYNDRVGFTPSIGRFAAESTVFERAFTRYGATGLSVPSIWTGGMMLHKQYVTPFGPMNALRKLLAVEEYDEWLSSDPILNVIAPADQRRDAMDTGTSVKDHRLCGTLDQVRRRFDRLKGTASPTFVYSLSQDVHVSSIAREGSRPIDDLLYEGFNAAYASRARRFDDCFGRFVGDLKSRGLYDDSLIILTADHGDSLGEGGRMGHAYTIFPEIIQVPLIVHLPDKVRGEMTADTKAVAFTSDLAPSLYRLLGHEPTAPAPFFGRPLFRRAGSPAAVRPAAEIVASSYGSVYGALLDDARRLYIIDAVSLREYEYELDGTAPGRPIDVRPFDRDAGQRAIRATVNGIAAFFRYPAGIEE